MAESSYTDYHDVEQRSPEWHALRRVIGGSSVGAEIGLSPYRRPGEKSDSGPNPRRDAAFKHGEECEEKSANVFLSWLKCYNGDTIFTEETVRRWQEQRYDKNPGYDVPIYPHPYFTQPDDRTLFGLSLDMRGSVIDVELKNPMSYFSFLSNYVNRVQAVYFAQVQWAMAMRVRNSMFFVATSYEADTGIHQGTVIWYITFSEEFFRETLYPRARVAGLTAFAAEPNTLDWMNESSRYEKSEAYRALCERHCRQVFLWKNGAHIARRIREKKATQ